MRVLRALSLSLLIPSLSGAQILGPGADDSSDSEGKFECDVAQLWLKVHADSRREHLEIGGRENRGHRSIGPQGKKGPHPSRCDPFC